MTKRIICAVLSALFILSAFSSCGVPLTEDEAKEIAAPLIEKSYAVNEIFFGKGLPHIEDNTEETGDKAQYDVKPVKYLSAATDEYADIDALKDAAREVYTESYLNDVVFPNAFSGISNSDGSYYQYARYISDIIGGISVRVGLEEESITKGRTYDVSTLKITGGGRGYVYFTVQSYVDGAEDLVVPLSLKDEGDGWRLDSPTY